MSTKRSLKVRTSDLFKDSCEVLKTSIQKYRGHIDRLREPQILLKCVNSPLGPNIYANPGPVALLKQTQRCEKL